MKKNNNPTGCGRKEDLVTYLYDEAKAEERDSFELHLSDCSSCRSELNSFVRVRDDLRAWEVGFTPRTEIVLQKNGRKSGPKSIMDSLREFLNLFPAWARGVALTAASLALLLFALSFGPIGQRGDLDSAMNPEQVESLVKEAIARERERMQQDFRAQMADYREQLKTEHELQLNALSAQQAAKLEAVKTELKRFNRQNTSIRSFFAMDDLDDPLGDHQ
jgi:Putative zinc-finger